MSLIKNNEAGNSLNAIVREPVPTRVLNPNASEASYNPKQRSYRKTKLFFFLNIFEKLFKIKKKIEIYMGRKTNRKKIINRNRLNRKTNKFSDFSNFLFFELWSF